MSNIYAYDFDGVIHKSVTPPDVYGQRNELPIKNYTPFTKIINQIKNQQLTNKVYIITARDLGDPKPLEYLTEHNLSNLEIYYTNNQDKSEIIKKLKITEFYDDSILRINQTYDAILPNLKKLYLVIPETDNWIEINDDNIDLYKIN
jgi:hypothetical protein